MPREREGDKHRQESAGIGGLAVEEAGEAAAGRRLHRWWQQTRNFTRTTIISCGCTSDGSATALVDNTNGTAFTPMSRVAPAPLEPVCQCVPRANMYCFVSF